MSSLLNGKEVTYEVIKKNVKGRYTKPYDVIKYKVYFDGVAGAYQYKIYNSEFFTGIGHVYKDSLKKTKNGEYCYTFEYEKLAGHPIKILLYGRDKVYVINGIRELLPLQFDEF